MSPNSRAVEEALQKLARGLVEAENVRVIADVTAEVTRDLFEWDAFFFSERIPGTDEFLRVVAWDTFDGERREVDPSLCPPRPYHTAKQLHRGEPILLDNRTCAGKLNTFGDPNRISQTLMFAPILREKTLRGTISVQSYTPGRYDKGDLKVLALMGEMITPAMRRAQAERELMRKIEEAEAANAEVRRTSRMQQAFYQIARSVRVAASLSDLYARVHEGIRLVVAADRFQVALKSSNGQAVRFVYDRGMNAHREEQDVPIEQTLIGRPIVHRRPIRLDKGEIEALARTEGLNVPSPYPDFWLGMPLARNGDIIGAIGLFSYSLSMLFDPRDVGILEFVSGEIAGAIDYFETQHELRINEDRYRRAIAVAGAVPYERDFGDSRWRHMGEGIRELTGYAPAELNDELWRSMTLKIVPRGGIEGLSVEEGAALVKAGKVGTWRADYLMRAKDGTERWVGDASVLTYDDEGKLTGTIGLLWDITEEVQAQRLQQAREMLGVELSRARTLEEVGESIGKVLDEFFGWDAFFLDLYDSETGLAKSVISYDTMEDGRRRVPPIYARPSVPTKNFQQVVAQGNRLISDATQGEAPVARMLYGNTTRRSASLLYVPIKHTDGTVLALFSIQSYTPGQYSESDLQFATTLADHCGGALYRTAASEQLREAQQRLALFADVARQLSHVLTPHEAGLVISQAADNLFKWDACFLDLYDPESETAREMMYIDVVNGERREVAGSHGKVTLSPSERRVLKEGAFILNREREGENPENLRPIGNTERRSASLMFVPAVHADNTVAFISFQSYTPNAFTEEDLEALHALADYCAGALHRIRLEHEVRAKEERFALAAQGANDGIWDWDIPNDRIYVSPRGRGLLRLDPAVDYSGLGEWLHVVHPDDRPGVQEAFDLHLGGKTEYLQYEYRVNHGGHDPVWILCRGMCVRDESGNPVRMAGSITDITDRKRNEEELIRTAFHDSLTRLANRALFMDRLSQCIERARRHPEFRFAVLFMDLDGFKQINDTYGHPGGDALLQGFAERLRQHFRSVDTVARMGGDEFTVLLEDLHEKEELRLIAERLLERIAPTFAVGDHTIQASTSIGIALNRPGDTEVDGILREADEALYQAKARGKGCFVIHGE